MEFEPDKLERAKKRVEELKGFYIHMAVYVVVNVFILVNIYLRTDYFWQWPHFVTLFGWGLGLGFHAAKVFGFNPMFGRKWEERQIQKYIDKDKEEAKKYK
ncbi:hypothetical protein DX873_03150 [Flagellimonas nanhaiensis]|uniref:2TM domain-containing protein n=2 Tax=Flagellimonas nanhaiensis TaxID=2292706 RepID=A0A371JW17_9FLAO|nr:hypothetical protein DX873_03150 [Allomuricauda nanhaiensis]